MAQRIGGPTRRDRIPGLWKHLQQSQIDEIRRGDARGFGMSEDAKATLNDHPNSTVTQARAVLAGMDRGDAMLSWPPTARELRERLWRFQSWGQRRQWRQRRR
jgi:hypothetical protein